MDPGHDHLRGHRERLSDPSGRSAQRLLRWFRFPDQHRPFRMPLFPVPAIAFALLYLWLGISGAIREPELLPYIIGGWIVAALLERLGRQA